MERILFTVSPVYNGWQVRDELRNRDWFEQLEDAVASADTQARHALTGNGTGVLVDVGEGDAIMRARHGQGLRKTFQEAVTRFSRNA